MKLQAHEKYWETGSQARGWFSFRCNRYSGLQWQLHFWNFGWRTSHCNSAHCNPKMKLQAVEKWKQLITESSHTWWRWWTTFSKQARRYLRKTILLPCSMSDAKMQWMMNQPNKPRNSGLGFWLFGSSLVPWFKIETSGIWNPKKKRNLNCHPKNQTSGIWKHWMKNQPNKPRHNWLGSSLVPWFKIETSGIWNPNKRNLNCHPKMKLQAYENIGWRTSLISQDADGSAAGCLGAALFHGSRLKL